MNECELRDFPMVLEQSILKRKLIEKKVLQEIGKIVRDKAKELIGHEQPEWASLSPYTIADRVARGYAPNEPLLREGKLRDALQYEVLPLENSVCIGYQGSEVAKYARVQELGYGKVPPRPTLKTALFREFKKIIQIVSPLGYIFKTYNKSTATFTKE